MALGIPGEGDLAQTVMPDQAGRKKIMGVRERTHRVIGVAADVRRVGLDRPVAESVYFPLESLPDSPVFSPPRALRVAMRVKAADTPSLMERVRSSAASNRSASPPTTTRGSTASPRG